jgi:hypothetical protein
MVALNLTIVPFLAQQLNNRQQLNPVNTPFVFCYGRVGIAIELAQLSLDHKSHRPVEHSKVVAVHTNSEWLLL